MLLILTLHSSFNASEFASVLSLASVATIAFKQQGQHLLLTSLTKKIYYRQLVSEDCTRNRIFYNFSFYSIWIALTHAQQILFSNYVEACYCHLHLPLSRPSGHFVFYRLLFDSPFLVEYSSALLTLYNHCFQVKEKTVFHLTSLIAHDLCQLRFWVV